MHSLSWLLVACFAMVSALDIVSPSEPSRAEASRLISKARWADARTELDRILEQSPGDGVCWFQQAVVNHRLGDSAKALVAYRRAADTPGVAAEACYNAACLLALAGQTDEAWEFLDRAVTAGFGNGRLMEADTDLASLRAADGYAARWDRLMARLPAVPMLDPRAPTTFLEPEAEVLWSFAADSGLERFGWQSEVVGDVNGDGIADILGGSPRSAHHAERAGKAWLLSGADGSVIRTHEGTTKGGHLGFHCKPAGDLDRDGTPDYIVTAPGGNTVDGSVPPGEAGLPHRGEVFIYSGADGSELFAFQGASSVDRFGFDVGVLGTAPSVATTDVRDGAPAEVHGDVNGDGYAEILVGAPGAHGAASHGGRAVLLSGKDGSILRTHEGSVELERLGSSVGILGDLDGDGVGDYVLGSPGAGAARGGQASVYSGTTGKRLFVLDPAESDPSSCSVEFGRFFASSAGDLDGDSIDDIYLADSFDQTHGISSGRVYLFSGATGRLLYSLAGRASNDWYGIGRGLHEDVDGDGTPDLVIAALAGSEGAPGAGRVDIVSGRDGELIHSYTCTNASLNLGYDAHPVGDVDGDGIGEIFVTGSWGPWRPDFRGRGVLLRGRAAPAQPAADVSSEPAAARRR